jgi:hypothetical protein
MAHSTDNYISGNGIPYLYLRPTPYAEPEEIDWVDMGDAVSFQFTPKVTKKIHQSHRTGVQSIDKRVKVKEEGELKVTLTEFFLANLQLFLSGTLDVDGSTIYPMEGGTDEYGIRFVQTLISGEERIYEFWRADIMASGAMDLIVDGEGETDWAKMELTITCLDDSVEHPGKKWGRVYLAPTT